MPNTDNLNSEWQSVLLALVAFIIVIVGAYYASKLVSKKSVSLSKGKYIEIIDKAMLANDKWLCIVKVAQKCYLISVTSSAINIIAELSLDEIPYSIDTDKQQSNTPFAKYMQEFIRKIGNKTDETLKH